MSGSDNTRRRFLVGSGYVLAGGVIGFSVSPLLASGRAVAPSVPMRLSRTIRRELRDGAVLAIEREWKVQFSPQGRGIVVSGSQIHVSVDAPQKLAPLAAIEKGRSTDDMWPILLAEDGKIVAAGQYIQEHDVASAVREAEAMVARRERSAEVRARDLQYLSDLQRAGSSLLEQMPPDLFFPKESEQSLVRTVALPEGGKGEFAIKWIAQTAKGAGWLAFAKRHITTRVGRSSRSSSDTWRMTEF